MYCVPTVGRACTSFNLAWGKDEEEGLLCAVRVHLESPQLVLTFLRLEFVNHGHVDVVRTGGNWISKGGSSA